MNRPIAQPVATKEYLYLRIEPARSGRMQRQFGEFIVWMVRLWA